MGERRPDPVVLAFGPKMRNSGIIESSLPTSTGAHENQEQETETAGGRARWTCRRFLWQRKRDRGPADCGILGRFRWLSDQSWRTTRLEPA
ncbi:hypothetical protein B0T17DRAFT_533737 [Bombardia bombarda]|uniref:Uncharacterized protein n=1 Tax=Bombardia bombarda TaxID=252184 RepID=A0AA39WTL0_9PEZI|nr:hypothetical protein B0T17DRAFT_533737 [Bombardia bombarda]